MPREVDKYLLDVKMAGELIKQFSVGKSFSDYEQDALLRSGVERQFAIIGEALNKASERDPSLRVKISGLARIVAFRNILIHAYVSISNQVVWSVMQKDLPKLLNEVEALLPPPRP